MNPKELDEEIFRAALNTVMPQVTRLLELSLTITGTIVDCECSFSALKRVKARLRSTIGEERLSDLSCCRWSLSWQLVLIKM